MIYYVQKEGRKTQEKPERKKKMFEVSFMNWEGREEEPEVVFETLEEAETYIEEYEEKNMVDLTKDLLSMT